MWVIEEATVNARQAAEKFAKDQSFAWTAGFDVITFWKQQDAN